MHDAGQRDAVRRQPMQADECDADIDELEKMKGEAHLPCLGLLLMVRQAVSRGADGRQRAEPGEIKHLHGL